MNDDFTLVPMHAFDLDRAAKLHADAFGPSGERGWSPQEIAGLLASPGVAGFLLMAGTADVGMAICRVAADEAELLTVAVSSECRRRGAGRRLLWAAVEHARRAGARSLFLEVGADNCPAQSLYLSLGFTQVGRRMAYYTRANLPPNDASVMRLTLT
jgi:ribosomal-protein-alanine N-acetyltransferase